MARPIQITPTLSGIDSKNFNAVIASSRNKKALSKKRVAEMSALYKSVMKKALI